VSSCVKPFDSMSRQERGALIRELTDGRPRGHRGRGHATPPDREAEQRARLENLNGSETPGKSILDLDY